MAVLATLLHLLMTCSWCVFCRAEGDVSTRVLLPQGVVTGVKLFTESRVRLNAYLGIPYALPPIGDLRFAPPEVHPGWNSTLNAEHYRADCLQPAQPISSAMQQSQPITDEDCLYLNIFVPEVAMTYRDFPVLVFVHGVDYVTGSPLSVTAEDLSSEGLIVVTFSYRLNVFGFFSLGDEAARGNLGLLDQYLAIKWVKDNVQYFGGVPDNVTLMGHSSGASSVLIHMTSPRTKDMFQKAILMSGALTSPWLQSWPSPSSPSGSPVVRTSRYIARSLGCSGESLTQNRNQVTRATITCLRQKSGEEVLRAFDNVYKNGNWSECLGPMTDSYLPSRTQYLPEDPVLSLFKGQYHHMPIITGITSNEGTLVLNRWRDLLNQSRDNVRHFIEHTAVSNVLTRYRLNSSESKLIVMWNYVDKLRREEGLVQAVLKLYNDAMFTAPFWLQLQTLSLTNQKHGIFVYHFAHPTFDPLGNFKSQLNLSSSAHGSELLYLFGPTLFEKIAGRRFTTSEERLSLKMKRLWTYFIRSGDPTPSSYDYALWDPFTPTEESFLRLHFDHSTGQHLTKLRGNPEREVTSFWNDLLPRMDNSTKERMKRLEQALVVAGATNIALNRGDCSSYKHAMFTTLGFLILLLVILILCLILLKKRTKERDRSIL